MYQIQYKIEGHYRLSNVIGDLRCSMYSEAGEDDYIALFDTGNYLLGLCVGLYQFSGWTLGVKL